MSRKDYKLLVLAIAQARLDKRNFSRLWAALAPALESDNPNFNRAKFATAVMAIREGLDSLNEEPTE